MILSRFPIGLTRLACKVTQSNKGPKGSPRWVPYVEKIVLKPKRKLTVGYRSHK